MHTTCVLFSYSADTVDSPKRHASHRVNMNPVPDTTTGVPPPTGPDPGVTPVTDTSPWCVNVADGPVTNASPLFDTHTPSADPSPPSLTALSAGAAHSACDDDSHRAATTAPPADDPNRHASSSESTKFDPCTVTSVPPDAGPLAGDTLDTPAAAMYRYCTPSAE